MLRGTTRRVAVIWVAVRKLLRRESQGIHLKMSKIESLIESSAKGEGRVIGEGTGGVTSVSKADWLVEETWHQSDVESDELSRREMRAKLE